MLKNLPGLYLRRKIDMSIENIQILSNNPHFSALLLHSFLTGYKKECELSIAMIAIPLLYNREMRKKLLRANKNSSPQTLFLYSQQGKDLSGQSKLAGFWNKYDILEYQIKNSLIILYSENKISFKKNIISLENEINYRNYKGESSNWLRAAYYLGIILKKATFEDLVAILRS